METPKDVLNKVAVQIMQHQSTANVGKVDALEIATTIIPLAQLPIAPATEEEAELALSTFSTGMGKPMPRMRGAIDQLFSRRNSPPQVDSRIAVVVEELGLPELPWVSKRVRAIKILAALDAMKK